MTITRTALRRALFVPILGASLTAAAHTVDKPRLPTLTLNPRADRIEVQPIREAGTFGTRHGVRILKNGSLLHQLMTELGQAENHRFFRRLQIKLKMAEELKLNELRLQRDVVSRKAFEHLDNYLSLPLGMTLCPASAGGSVFVPHKTEYRFSDTGRCFWGSGGCEVQVLYEGQPVIVQKIHSRERFEALQKEFARAWEEATRPRRYFCVHPQWLDSPALSFRSVASY